MNDMIDTSSDLRDQITIDLGDQITIDLGDQITIDLGEVFTQDDADYEQRARWEESMTMEDIF